MAAYLVSSADFSSIKTNGFPCRTKGAYNASITFRASDDVVPITTRSGFMKSSTATPSLKNSGFDTTSNTTFALAEIFALTLSAVPTGTVLLSTITVYSFKSEPNSPATPSMYFKSAEPSSPGGVGRARKMILAFLIPSSRLFVNCNLPCLRFRSNSTSKPGS